MPERNDYREPEIARVGDASSLTLGDKTPVADVGGEPSAGYRDASSDPARAGEERELDV